MPYALGVYLVRQYIADEAARTGFGPEHLLPLGASSIDVSHQDVGSQAGFLAAAFSFAQVRSLQGDRALSPDACTGSMHYYWQSTPPDCRLRQKFLAAQYAAWLVASPCRYAAAFDFLYSLQLSPFSLPSHDGDCYS